MALSRRNFTTTQATAAEVRGDMLAPSLANKQWVRLAATALVVAGLARSTGFLPVNGVLFVHMLANATWLGSVVWTTFIAGITMFKNLPRQTFGRLQSKLFPLYFGLNAVCTTVMLGTLKFGLTSVIPAREYHLIGLALFSTLGNLLFVEPIATKVMFERYGLENTEGARDEDAIKKLYKKFSMFHGVSSLLNLVVLVCAVGHSFYLANHLAL